MYAIRDVVTREVVKYVKEKPRFLKRYYEAIEIRGTPPTLKRPPLLSSGQGTQLPTPGEMSAVETSLSSYAPPGGGIVWVIRRTIPGIGDAVMLEPLVSIMAERLDPLDELWVQTLDWTAPVFEHHPSISRILLPREQLPARHRMALNIAVKQRCPCALYEARSLPEIEKNRDQIHVESALDGQLAYDGRSPRIYLSALEADQIRGFKLRTPDKLIGVQMRSAEEWRDYPHMNELIFGMTKRKGWRVYLFDSQPVPRIPGTVGVSGKPLREVITSIAAMDVFVAPDSGLGHIAAGLGVPLYSIFGPTDPSIRMGNYDGQISFETKHVRCDTSKRGTRCWYRPCPDRACLDGLKPRAILKSVRRLLDQSLGDRERGEPYGRICPS